MRLARPRTLLLVGLLFAGIASAWHLGLGPTAVWPTAERWSVLGDFLGSAFSPTLTSESDLAINILPRTLRAAAATVAVVVTLLSAGDYFSKFRGVISRRERA